MNSYRLVYEGECALFGDQSLGYLEISKEEGMLKAVGREE